MTIAPWRHALRGKRVERNDYSAIAVPHAWWWWWCLYCFLHNTLFELIVYNTRMITSDRTRRCVGQYQVDAVHGPWFCCISLLSIYILAAVEIPFHPWDLKACFKALALKACLEGLKACLTGKRVEPYVWNLKACLKGKTCRTLWAWRHGLKGGKTCPTLETVIASTTRSIVSVCYWCY